jgi:hypothetical protein
VRQGVVGALPEQRRNRITGNVDVDHEACDKAGIRTSTLLRRVDQADEPAKNKTMSRDGRCRFSFGSVSFRPNAIKPNDPRQTKFDIE